MSELEPPERALVISLLTVVPTLLFLKLLGLLPGEWNWGVSIITGAILSLLVTLVVWVYDAARD